MDDAASTFRHAMNQNAKLKLLALLLLASLVLPVAIAAEKGGQRLTAKPKAKPAPKAEEKKPEPSKGDEEKPFDDVVKDMEVLKGLFTFYRKAEENRILMEILPEQLDKTFLFA